MKPGKILFILLVLIADVSLLTACTGDRRTATPYDQEATSEPNVQFESQSFSLAGIDFEYFNDRTENYYPVLTLSGQEAGSLMRQTGSSEIQIYGVTEQISIDLQRLYKNEGFKGVFAQGTLVEIDEGLQKYIADNKKPVSILLIIPNTDISSNDEYVAGFTEIPNLIILYHADLVKSQAGGGKVASLSLVTDVNAQIVGGVAEELIKHFLLKFVEVYIELRKGVVKDVNNCLVGKWEYVENISGDHQLTGVTIEFPEKNRGTYFQYDGKGNLVSTGQYRWQTKGTAIGLYLFLKPEGEQKEKRFDLKCDRNTKTLTLIRPAGSGRYEYSLQRVSELDSAVTEEAKTPSLKCNWQEKIVGKWAVPQAPGYGLYFIEFKKSGNLSGSIHYPLSPDFESLWQGDYEGKYFCLDNGNIKIISSAGEIVAQVDISENQNINAEVLKLSVTQDSMTNGEKTEYEFWPLEKTSEGTTSNSGQDFVCPSSLPTRLQIGMTAQVTTSGATKELGIRHQVGPDIKRFDLLQPGTKFQVLDGPKCYDNSYWWYVLTEQGIEGWLREGKDDYYLLDPLSSVEVTQKEESCSWEDKIIGQWALFGQGRYDTEFLSIASGNGMLINQIMKFGCHAKDDLLVVYIDGNSAYYKVVFSDNNNMSLIATNVPSGMGEPLVFVRRH